MEGIDSRSGVWRIIRREPLIAFVLVGSLVYLVWVALAPADVEIVRIDPEVLRAVETQREELLGRPLTAEEREIAHSDFIDDEVLLREALRRGLHWSDFRVRQRLTRIIRGSLVETVADPSVAQLQAYFRDNVDRFTRPESVSFDQVVYPWGDETTDAEIEQALVSLRAGADPARFGSSSVLAPPWLPKQTRVDLVQGMGPEFADAMEGLVPGDWHGPFDSFLGRHLVRVVERHPPEVATFEDVEPFLRQEWLGSKTRELQQEGIDAIRARYRIEVAAP